MTKLYRKAPLVFALIWIAVYVAGFSIADNLSERLGHPKLLTLLLGGILTALLLNWLKSQDLLSYFGLKRPQIPAKKMLFYWPMAAMVLVNLLLVPFQWVEWNIPHLLVSMGSMVFVGILEEVIFRGLLFRAMAKNDLRSAIIVSSITFGFGHIFNLINSAPIPSTLLQIVYATAVGFLFTMIFLKTGSILPCILCHCAVNMAGTMIIAYTSDEQILSALALILLSAIYAWWIIKYHPNNI